MKTKCQPITDRFNNYSDEDKRADGLHSDYKDKYNWDTHGGILVHELPPHLQKMIYDFAELKHKVSQLLSDKK